MNYWGWALFLFNEFFNLIVLLNFLIAIISQSYDEVMGKETVNKYQSRCSINLEIAQLQDAMIFKNQEFKMETNTMLYLVATAAHSEHGNEFQGFVKTIQGAIKQENKQLKDELKKIMPGQDVMSTMKSQIEDTRNQVDQVRNKVEQSQSEMRDLKDSMLKVLDHLQDIQSKLKEKEA